MRVRAEAAVPIIDREQRFARAWPTLDEAERVSEAGGREEVCLDLPPEHGGRWRANEPRDQRTDLLTRVFHRRQNSQAEEKTKLAACRPGVKAVKEDARGACASRMTSRVARVFMVLQLPRVLPTFVPLTRLHTQQQLHERWFKLLERAETPWWMLGGRREPEKQRAGPR
jgi:hypothetical protein